MTRHRSWHWFLILLLLICVFRHASALDPHTAMKQYLRTTWTTEEGFPVGQVSAIAQTPDGYLWIGGEKGLARFDGLIFQPIKESREGNPITHVLGLAIDGEGGLWIWMQGANVIRYFKGSFENVTSSSALPDANVTAMSQTFDGGVLLSTIGQETFEYKQGHLTPAGFTNLPDTLILANAKTTDGRIWTGTRDNGLLYLQAGLVVPLKTGLALGKINVLFPGKRNDLWVGTDDGLLYWDGVRMSNAHVPSSLRHKQILTILSDRDENLWIGTPLELSRFSIAAGSMSQVTVDRRKAGTSALLEDREGNLWFGNAKGIERWKDGVFIAYPIAEGFPDSSSGPIFADSKNRQWFGPSQGGLYSIVHGKLTPRTASIGTDVIYSLDGRGNDLWVGRQRGGVTHLFEEKGQLASKTYTQKDGLAQNSVYAVHESPDGTVWAGTLSAGLSALRNGAWTTYTTADGLASNAVTAIEDDVDGNTWVGTPTGLNLLTQGHWQTYTTHNNLPSDEITSLLKDKAANVPAVWIGTAGGLALWTSGKFRTFAPISEVLREPILGLALDRNGYLWIATPDHIVRLNRQDLLKGTLENTDIREYDHSDGLAAAEGVRRTRSMVSDSDGRIWISTDGGVAVTTPGYLSRPSTPSPVEVQTIVADGHPVSVGHALIPSSQRRIVFTFASMSLSSPQRVRYRYRMDGFDKGWSDASSTREAIYTNLDPGSYRFHVIASNSDGIWNPLETSLPFVVEPALWQTWWFRSFCLAFIALIVWLAYLLRMRELARQLHLRFEERLAERMRIAQDLHDTLLQGFLSASLQLDVAAEYIPRDSPAAPMLSRVLVLMRQVSEDCRRSLKSLRTAETIDRSLEEALSSVPQQLGLQQETTYRVIVNGAPRPLETVCSDELFLIGREAVLNAYRHANATLVEVELAYKRTGLHLFVRDDGHGIDAAVARLGKDGHWGLTGMRERAGKVGAVLRIWSRPEKGTEVEVTIPGEIVYLHAKQRTLRDLLQNRVARRFAKAAAARRTT